MIGIRFKLLNDRFAEGVGNNMNASMNAQIECPIKELEDVLEKIVKVTEEYSLNSLLDLYNHLNLIVKKYARNHIRTSLPKVGFLNDSRIDY